MKKKNESKNLNIGQSQLSVWGTKRKERLPVIYRACGNTIKCVCILESQKERQERRGRRTLEEIVAVNYTFNKSITLHIQEAQETPSRFVCLHCIVVER